FNVFGPHQDPNSQYSAVVPRFVAAIAAGRPPPLPRNGAQARALPYAANNVEAEPPPAGGPPPPRARPHGAPRRGDGRGGPAHAIASVVARPVVKEFLPERTGDVRDSWADVERARELLGYEPRISLEEGLRLTVDAQHG